MNSSLMIMIGLGILAALFIVLKVRKSFKNSECDSCCSSCNKSCKNKTE